jgi:hypothetical protein
LENVRGKYPTRVYLVFGPVVFQQHFSFAALIILELKRGDNKQAE